MTNTEIRFLLQIILLLLVLGVPPLTIWIGKTLRNLRGWQWTAAPFLFTVAFLMITFTTTGVQTVLKIDFGWDESIANNVGLIFYSAHMIIFVWYARGGKPLSEGEKAQKDNGQGSTA